MTSLLYYSISSNLTRDEIIEIDKQVQKNRKAVYLFVKELPLNSKRKAKRLFLNGIFIFQVSQPLVPCVAAVIMPLPPAAIHRLSPIEQDRIRSNKNGYPQIAHILEEKVKVDKLRLTDDKIKEFNNLALQLNSGSITMEEAVLQLRGGGELSHFLGMLAIMYFIKWYFGVDAFQATPLPHQDPFGWLSGKYDSKNAGNGQCLSRPLSRFDRETLHQVKQMCAASADENGFVMSYDEALNLLKETYGGGFRQITEDCKMTDWQSAKKAYHFQTGFGMDLDKYPNISKEDLVTLQKAKGGLIGYVRKGGKLPPIEFIKDCQQKIYDFCRLENTEINRDAKHYSNNTGETPSIMFFNRETQEIALFNKTTGDLITAGKFSQPYFNRSIDFGQVGKPKN